MKIIYFSQFFIPESIAPAFRAWDNSRIWSLMGHKVTIFTGYPNYPIGRIFKGYTVKMIDEEKIDGVRVLRSKLIAKPNSSIINRLENAFSFFVFGLVNLLFNRKKIHNNYDVVLGTSGVIFTGLLAYIFAKLIKSPFIFELRDITYRQLIATGREKSSISVRMMRKLELFLCQKAKYVVVVTTGFKKILIEDGICANKIFVITNGVDVEIEYEHKLSNKNFVLSYFGTLGISQNIIDTFPYATAISKWCQQYKYIIIGEGAQREEVQKELEKKQYPYITLLPGMSVEDLESYYKDTDLSVITLRKSDDFKYTLPSKLFQVMGRGIAVLFIGPEGEASSIIKKYNAGLTLTGTFDEDFKKLETFFSCPDWKDKLYRMGQNGAAAVKKYYSRKKLALDYINVLETSIKE